MRQILNNLPPDTKKIHFIGIGGIGMSAIAQFLHDSGYEISGSDRGLSLPENEPIIAPMQAAGIQLFPQDGTFIRETQPDLLVYSTAIESDNPDFTAAPDIPKMHRAEMLNECINAVSDKISVAVAGSCGKTSVTAWLTETLFNAGLDPMMIGGGLSKRFISPLLAGNFKPGKGNYFVFEADESDKSLLNYKPDFALILNMEEDHYSMQELTDTFREFAGNIRKGVVVSREVFEILGHDTFRHIATWIFDSTPISADISSAAEQWYIEKYAPTHSVFANSSGTDALEVKLPSPGKHTALNALAVLCAVNMLDLKNPGNAACIGNFHGVKRRFEYMGRTCNGADVYDDYAHNTGKITSCILTAKEYGKKVLAVFQPHGFKPLALMKNSLFNALEKTLGEEDIFCFLPVYYAGGTTSFSPTAEEVAGEYKAKGLKHYKYFPDRESAECFLTSTADKNTVIIVMGARDNSLSVFASFLACGRS